MSLQTLQSVKFLVSSNFPLCSKAQDSQKLHFALKEPTYCQYKISHFFHCSAAKMVDVNNAMDECQIQNSKKGANSSSVIINLLLVHIRKGGYNALFTLVGH